MKAMEAQDRGEIRDLVENWVLWRDAGEWEKFRTVWHDDGLMMATWQQSTAADFIDSAKESFGKGRVSLHFLGGQSIELSGNRAISQTKMTITSRAVVEGVLCDVTCTGRFYDLIEKRSGRWGMVLRQPIYETDRIDAVKPGEFPQLDPAILESYPAGYRHLAYLQAGLGLPVKRDMPGLTGPEVDALYARGQAWLAGEPLLRPLPAM
tara:strand:+ start:1762 stop:2385 length:624 start_codon:yes stop_codon:yes gene_type:complete